MTGAEFYAYCKRIFKRTDKETEFYEVLTDVIMDMKLRFNSEDYKVEAFSAAISTLGNYKFAVPSDFGHLIGDIIWRESYGNSNPLIKISKASYDALYPYPSASDVKKDRPKHYCLYGGEFFIGPVPDSISYTYLINFTTELATTMTSDTASVPFVDRYRWILRDLVLAEFYSLHLNQFDKGEFYRTRGELGLAKIVENENNNTNAPAAVAYNDL